VVIGGGSDGGRDVCQYSITSVRPAFYPACRQFATEHFDRRARYNRAINLYDRVASQRNDDQRNKYYVIWSFCFALYCCRFTFCDSFAL